MQRPPLLICPLLFVPQDTFMQQSLCYGQVVRNILAANRITQSCSDRKRKAVSILMFIFLCKYMLVCMLVLIIKFYLFASLSNNECQDHSSWGINHSFKYRSKLIIYFNNLLFML